MSSVHCHCLLLAPEQESFDSEFLSCSVIRENHSEVEDAAPGKKNQIWFESLFFLLISCDFGILPKFSEGQFSHLSNNN